MVCGLGYHFQQLPTLDVEAGVTDVSAHRAAGGPRSVVNRNGVMDTLTRLAEAAQAGQSRAIVVRGEAGSGRTTLLRTLRRTCLGQDTLVLEAAGRTASPAEAYATARELFASLGLSLPHCPERPCHRTTERVSRMMAKLAADRPVAVLIDDAHLCDEESLRCVDLLLRRSTGLPLLVLLTDCPDEAGPGRQVVGEISTRASHCAIVVPPLRSAEVAHVVARTLGEVPEPGFTQRCTQVSGGNPQLLQDLLVKVRKRGIRPDVPGSHLVDEIGRRVRASFAVAGLARRTGHVRRVAQGVALLGEAAQPELVSAFARVPQPAAMTALGSLRREGLLARGEAGYRADLMCSGLRTRLLRELSGPELRTARIRAAQILNDAGRPAEEVARLLPGSPDEPWMLDVLREASADTARRGAPLTSAAYLRRVIDADATGTTDSALVGDRLELARILIRICPPSAVPHLRWVLDRDTDPRLRTYAAILLAAAAVGTKHAAYAAAALDEAAVAFQSRTGAEPDPADEELLAYAAYTRSYIGLDGKVGTSTVLSASASARSWTGSTRAERRLLVVESLHVALESQSPERTLDLVRRGLRVPEAPGAGARWPLPPELPAAVALYLADEAEEARALLGRTHDRYGRHEDGDPWVQLMLLSTQSLVSHAVGDVSAATRQAKVAQRVVARAPDARGLALPKLARFQVLVEQNRLDCAQVVLDGIDAHRAEDSWYEQPLLRMATARLQLLRGDPHSALRSIWRCEDELASSGIRNPVFIRWQLLACQALEMLDRRGEVADIAEKSQELADRWRTPWAVGLGLLTASMTADRHHSVEVLERAVEVLSRSPGRLELTWAEYRLGAVLLRLGYPEGARAHLLRARRRAVRCGSRRLATRIGTLSTALEGGRIPPGTGLLTSSEHRVAVLAAMGATNQEIADRLFLSRRTVEAHLTSVYDKLRVSGRAGLRACLDYPGWADGPLRPGDEPDLGAQADHGRTERSRR
jgi:DNA-binding CsgD family transcriptional regulator